MSGPAAPIPMEELRRTGWIAYWDRYWFGEGSLCRLGAFRMILMAAAYYAVWHKGFGVFQHADGADAVGYLQRVWNPIYAFQILGLEAPGPQAARRVYALLVFFIALGFVGLFSRLSTFVVAALSFYWIGTAYSFGKPHHDCIGLMFALAILPFSPSGARLSVDSLVARWRSARRGGSMERPVLAAFAGLPLRLTMLTSAIGYFSSGVSKLVIAGFGWMNGYTLQGIMTEYRSDWSEPLADNLFLLQVMSVGLIATQVAFPIALFSVRSRWVFIPMSVGFHLMAMKTMATGPFVTLWFTLAAFIALERIPGVLRRGMTQGPVLWRMAFGALFLGISYGIVAIYMQHKSPWLLTVLLPIVLAVLFQCLPRMRVELSYSSSAARAWVAILRALDWGDLLRFRESDAGDATGPVSMASIAWRVPLLLPLSPFLAALEGVGLGPARGRFFRASKSSG